MKNKLPRYLRNISSLILAAMLLLVHFGAAAAQDGYKVDLRRDFGFGNGSQIRGTFTISLVGAEENVASVVFLVDEQKIAEVTQPPFNFQFNTNSYASGIHDLSAAVTLKDGSVETAAARRYQFVSAAEESQAMKEILFPLLAVVLGIIVVGMGSQFLAARGKPAGGPEPGTPRSYGFSGGSICPKCNRPTPIHPLGFNLVVGKLTRCENCGKWSVMRRVPLDILRAAEQAERTAEKGAAATVEKSAEDKLREMLDDSRYTRG